ncbi:MAG: RNA-binding domain-containing protein [Nitrosopumilaceae archaeon]|nr:RNA-binding domain-containing protein [Nitrosopumilaceae archaeon]
MKIPSLSCRIEIFCSVNPSEDPKKVETSILNVLPNCEIKQEKFSVKGISKNLSSLVKIRESIHALKHERIYRKNLEKNLSKNSSWFYLNKQAAFADKIAICEEADESPLGPLKIVLSSDSIEQIIEWLIFDDEIS